MRHTSTNILGNTDRRLGSLEDSKQAPSLLRIIPDRFFDDADPSNGALGSANFLARIVFTVDKENSKKAQIRDVLGVHVDLEVRSF